MEDKKMQWQLMAQKISKGEMEEDFLRGKKLGKKKWGRFRRRRGE